MNKHPSSTYTIYKRSEYCKMSGCLHSFVSEKSLSAVKQSPKCNFATIRNARWGQCTHKSRSVGFYGYIRLNHMLAHCVEARWIFWKYFKIVEMSIAIRMLKPLSDGLQYSGKDYIGNRRQTNNIMVYDSLRIGKTHFTISVYKWGKSTWAFSHSRGWHMDYCRAESLKNMIQIDNQ